MINCGTLIRPHSYVEIAFMKKNVCGVKIKCMLHFMHCVARLLLAFINAFPHTYLLYYILGIAFTSAI